MQLEISQEVQLENFLSERTVALTSFIGVKCGAGQERSVHSPNLQ